MIGKVCLQEKEDGVFMIFRPKPELMTAQNRECLQLICGMGALVQKELWIRGKAHRDAMTDEITGALNRSCLLPVSYTHLKSAFWRISITKKATAFI